MLWVLFSPRSTCAPSQWARFEWEHPFETQGSDWELMYSQLLEFRDAEGHCAVKKKYNENPALGYWVNDQRIAQRQAPP